MYLNAATVGHHNVFGIASELLVNESMNGINCGISKMMADQHELQ